MSGLQNNKMQLTSAGLIGALRAPSLMRRLQLILVLGGRSQGRDRDCGHQSRSPRAAIPPGRTIAVAICRRPPPRMRALGTELLPLITGGPASST